MRFERRTMALGWLALAVLSPGALPSAQTVQLSPPLERVESWVTTADGQGAVYRIHQDVFLSDLRLVRAARDLEDVSDPNFPGWFAVSPDSRRLVYTTADEDLLGYRVGELYSQPLDGSAPPIKLNGPLVSDGDVSRFWVSPDSRRVLYLAAEVAGSGAFSVPIDGSAPPVWLGVGVLEPIGLRISGDGRRVLLDGIVAGQHRLLTVPMDGSAPAQVFPGWSATAIQFRISQDSTRVVYRATQVVGAERLLDLYSAPLDASAAPVRLNPALVTGGNVGTFMLTSDGTRVAYLADQELNGRNELYSAPVDGSAPAVKLSAPIVTGEPRPDANYWWMLMAGSRVIFPATAFGGGGLAFSVPSDGSAPPVQIGAFHRGVSMVLTTAGSRFVFGDTVGNAMTLFSTPVDGSAPPVQLNLPLPPNGTVWNAVVDARGENVLYLADQETAGERELYWVPADGSRPPRKVNPTLPAGSNVSQFSFTRDGQRALYLADPHIVGTPELFLGFLAPAHRAR